MVAVALSHHVSNQMGSHAGAVCRQAQPQTWMVYASTYLRLAAVLRAAWLRQSSFTAALKIRDVYRNSSKQDAAAQTYRMLNNCLEAKHYAAVLVCSGGLCALHHLQCDVYKPFIPAEGSLNNQCLTDTGRSLIKTAIF